MLLAEMRRAIKRFHMMTPGDRVVVAVSGGSDSMALLHALAELRDELGVDLVVAHLDHALRPSSDAEARFVAETAARLGVRAVCERRDVAARAASDRRGIEETARDVRREFLEQTADECGAARVALGHTADDQAETVLFRLARGTGWSGLSAMSPTAGRFVRPLLAVRRDEARRFLVERGVSWREDPSNADVRFSRNRIRARVLPELAAVNPEAVRALNRCADLARDARALEQYVVLQLWPAVCLREGRGEVEIARAAMTPLPSAVQSVVLREAMRRARGDLEGLSRAHAAAARRLAVRGSGELDLPRLRVTASASTIRLASRPEARPDAGWTTPLAFGRTELAQPGVIVDVALAERDEVGGTAGPWTELADADFVRFPLVARGRRPGDVFRPLGMAADVRLASFLINARVPRHRRERIVVVCDQEKIVWVAGVRLSHEVRLRDSTRRVVVLRALEGDR